MDIELQQYELVSRILRVLGDTTRLRIIHALWDGPATVSRIVELAATPQTAVSRNLSVMHATGLVVRQRVGINVVYSISLPVVKELCAFAVRSEREIYEAKRRLRQN